MAQRAGRITCPKCGANNFDTVTSCWKCGAPVGVASSGPSGSPAQQAIPVQPSPPMATQQPFVQERPIAYSQPPPQQQSYLSPLPTGDGGVARRAAILLGLTIPFIGLPVGWIFMMIEDRQKQSVGRWCATWSMVGLVIHLVLTYVMVQNTVPFLLKVLAPIVAGASRRSSSGADGL